MCIADNILSIGNHFFKKNYEFFDILISLLAIIIGIAGIFVTIWLFNRGVKRVQDYFEEYSQRRRNAVFNYYTHLSSFLTGFECLISVPNSKEPQNVLYYVWLSDAKERNNYPSSDSAVKHLNEFAKCFLQYLYTASEQIPPDFYDTCKNREWSIKRNSLIRELNKLAVIKAPNEQTGDLTVCGVKKRHKEIQEIIDYFTGVIQNKTGIYQEEINKNSP